MPATGTMPSAATTEMTAVQPMVAINGAVFDYTTCLSIEQSAGITPAKAFIRISGNAYDVNGNITLNAYAFGIGFGARVAIFDSSDTLFLGCVIKRRDQGEANSVIYECWDDRWLLSKIPVRGCLVYDPVSGTVKFIDRYLNRVNPEGGRNCIGTTGKVSGVPGPCPVFSAYSEQSAGFIDRDTDDNWGSGNVSSWTPAKYLKYLCAIANLAPGAVAGTYKERWRHISASKRIKWDFGTVDFGSASELNQRMVDKTFQGQTILGALDEVLKISGEYALKVTYNGESMMSEIGFFKRAKDTAKKQNQSITLLRGGQAADIRTAYDFELEEDASEVCESCLIQGAAVKVESEFTTNALTLKHGWRKTPADLDEEATYLDCVKGVTVGVGPSAKKWATIPERTPKVGDTWGGMKKITLDTGAWPPKGVTGESKTAAKVVRQILARTYRCYQIDSDKCYTWGIMQGLNGQGAGKYTDTTKYPYLFLPRQVLGEQLQYYIDLSNYALRERLDVRVRVKRNTTFYDVSHNNGLRLSSNGSIWLDGLCEEDTPSDDRTFDGSLLDKTATARDVSINAAIPLDVRVSEYFNASSGDIDGGLTNDLGGGMMLYIDCPETFKEEVQVYSHPGPRTGVLLADGQTPVFDLAATGKAGSLSRVLTSDQENGRMMAHAQRRLNPRKLVKRISSWKLIGIRPEWTIGMWIDSISCRGQTGDQDYTIGAAIESLTYDFIQQVTTIGGLVAFTERNQNFASSFGKPIAMLAAPKTEAGLPGGIPHTSDPIAAGPAARMAAPQIVGREKGERPVEMPSQGRIGVGLGYAPSTTQRVGQGAINVGLGYTPTQFGGGPTGRGGTAPTTFAQTGVRGSSPQDVGNQQFFVRNSQVQPLQGLSLVDQYKETRAEIDLWLTSPEGPSSI